MDEMPEQAQREKREYSRPELIEFGTLRHTTKTDPEASTGTDVIPDLPLWGDPS